MIEYGTLAGVTDYAFSCTCSLIATGLDVGGHYAIALKRKDTGAYELYLSADVGTNNDNGDTVWKITMTNSDWTAFDSVYYPEFYLVTTDGSGGIPNITEVLPIAPATIRFTSTLTSCPAFITTPPVVTATPGPDGTLLTWTDPIIDDDRAHFRYNVNFGQPVGELPTSGYSSFPDAVGMHGNSYLHKTSHQKAGTDYYYQVVVIMDLKASGEQVGSEFPTAIGNFVNAFSDPVHAVAEAGDFDGPLDYQFTRDLKGTNSATLFAVNSSVGNGIWLVSENLVPGRTYSIWQNLNETTYIYAHTFGEYFTLLFAGYPVTREPGLDGTAVVSFAGNTVIDGVSGVHTRVASDDGIIVWGLMTRITPGTLPNGTVTVQPPGTSEPASYEVHEGDTSDRKRAIGNQLQLTFTVDSYAEDVYLTVDNLVLSEASATKRVLSWDDAVITVREGLGTPAYRVHRYFGAVSQLWTHPNSSDGSETFPNHNLVTDWITETEFTDEDEIYSAVWYVVEARMDMGETIDGNWRYIGYSGPTFLGTQFHLETLFNGGNYTNIVSWHPQYWGSIIQFPRSEVQGV